MLFLSRIRSWFAGERARHIFIYYDPGSQKTRRADPWVISIQLEQLCPDYQDLLDLIGKDINNAPIGTVRDDLMKQKKEAGLKLDAVSRELFGLRPLTDADGVTGGEAIGILTQFWLFMQQLAAEAALFTSSHLPTA